MGFSLGTQELADEFWRLQEAEDPAFLEAIKGLNFSLLFVCLDCPGSVDRQLALVFEDGRFAEIILTERPAPSDLRTARFDHTKYDCRVQAPVDTYMDMVKGEMDLVETLPKVKIDGDFGRLMANTHGFARFIEFLGTMDISS